MKWIFSMIIVLASVCTVTATVINVPTDVATIQGGIDAANNEDSVLVSSGTYVEQINFNGKDVTVMSVNGPERTTIDGNFLGSTVTISSSERGAVLDGFTITNGIGTLNDENHRVAGGIAVRGGSVATLRNLIIEGNNALGDTAMGGGIMVSLGSDALIEDVIIRDNEADYGGGLVAYDTNPTLRRVEVYGNHGRVTNGGLTFWNSASLVEQVLVHDNTARYMAAGIWVHEGGAPILNQVTVTDNSCTSPLISSRAAGGIGCSASSDPILVNSIIWGNLPNQIEFYAAAASNTINIQYSDIEGGEAGIVTNNRGIVIWGLGNIIENPLFANPDRNDFSLSASSPCRDAGTSLLIMNGDTLIDMESGNYCGTFPDMGFCEWNIAPGVYNVPGDFPTIQAAIDGLSSSDTILVSSGTYVEQINFNGKDVTVMSVNGPELTTIDGNAIGSTVTISSGERGAVLDGFTITNGIGTLNDENHRVAGGIAVRGGSVATLRNLIVEGNNALGDTAMGGGIMVSLGSDALIEDVIIRDNEADYGGGFVAYDANPTLRRVEVYGNHGRVTNGGLTFWTSASLVEQVLVHDNTARYMAAGIWVHEGGAPILNQVTVSDNSCTSPLISSRAAGGIGCSAGSDPILVNSIIWGNLPNQIEFYAAAASNTINIQYSDIEGGEAGIVTNHAGSFVWGLGNAVEDPLFVDTSLDDYSLQPGSPCIDQGAALLVVDGVTIIDMSSDEYLGSAPDMGAFESSIVSVDPDLVGSPQEFGLHQNYPNPFNPSTSITFNLPESGWVKLVIYDVNGRMVSTVIDGERARGYHSQQWLAIDQQGKPLGTGIYLYEMQVTDKQGQHFRDVRKLTLLK